MMTDDKKQLWARFVQSGAISDYLKFKDAAANSEQAPTDCNQIQAP